MEKSVQQAFEVTEEYDGVRMDKFLALLYPDLSRSYFQKLIKNGNVSVSDADCKPSSPVREGDLVTVRIPQAKQADIAAEDIPLDILYEDEDLLIVNKPKGMVVHPAPGHISGTLVNAVMYHCRDSLSGINGEEARIYMMSRVEEALETRYKTEAEVYDGFPR